MNIVTRYYQTYLDRHGDELGRALTISDDELRELDSKVRQLRPENSILLRRLVLVHLHAARLTAGQGDDSIICAHITVHANRVEAPVNGICERALQAAGRHPRVRCDEPEERRM